MGVRIPVWRRGADASLAREERERGREGEAEARTRRAVPKADADTMQRRGATRASSNGRET